MNIISHEGNAGELVRKHSLKRFNIGDQLTTGNDEVAIIVYNDSPKDIFLQGTYTLGYKNLKLLYNALALPIDYDGSIEAEIWFVSLLVQKDIIWRPTIPSYLRDDIYNFHFYAFISFTFSYRIGDAQMFFIAPALSSWVPDQVNDKTASDIMAQLPAILADKAKADNIPLIDLAKQNPAVISDYILAALRQKPILSLKLDLVSFQLHSLITDQKVADMQDSWQELHSAENLPTPRANDGTATPTETIAMEDSDEISPAEITPLYIADDAPTPTGAIYHNMAKEDFLYKYPAKGFYSGDILVVRPGQVAVTVCHNQSCDNFGPGRYILDSGTLSMTYLMLDHAFDYAGSIVADVWFLSADTFDCPFDKSSISVLLDAKFLPVNYVEIKVSGNFKCKISNGSPFLRNLLAESSFTHKDTVPEHKLKTNFLHIFKHPPEDKDDSYLTEWDKDKATIHIKKAFLSNLTFAFAKLQESQALTVMDILDMNSENLMAALAPIVTESCRLDGVEVLDFQLLSTASDIPITDIVDRWQTTYTGQHISDSMQQRILQKDTLRQAKRIYHPHDSTELMWRWPSNEFTMGTPLVVETGQIVMIIYQNKLCDVFGPGTYVLDINSLPLFHQEIKESYIPGLTFQIQFWFLHASTLVDVKWGTSTPIAIYDPYYSRDIHVNAFGTFSGRITDARLLLSHITAGYHEWGPELLMAYIGERFLQAIKKGWSKKILVDKIPVPDMCNLNSKELSDALMPYINTELSSYHIAVSDIHWQSIRTLDTPYPQHQQGYEDTSLSAQHIGPSVTDTRMTVPHIRDIQSHTTEMPAQNTPQVHTSGTAPPPMPESLIYHVLINNIDMGPIDLAGVEKLIAHDRLGRDTYMWKPGMAAWDKAANLPELTTYFLKSPPPPPIM